MRIVLSVTAGLLTALAVFLFVSPPKSTFHVSGEDDLVVSCDSVIDSTDSTPILDSALSRHYQFTIVEGKAVVDEVEGRHGHLDSVGPYDVTDRIEDHCDRRRTGRVAWMVFSLAPAAVLATIAVALPAIRRDFWTLPPNRQ